MELKLPAYPNLEAELSKIGWSYKKLGDFLGISSMAISRRMRRETDFSLAEIMKICEFFKKDVGYIFNHCEQE